MRLALAAACLAACLGACFAPAADCGPQGLDCGGDYVCSNTYECLPPEQIQRVQVRWTVGGAQPNNMLCDSIGDLEITIRSLTTDDERSWAPVPCSLGLFTFDRLPEIYDRVTLSVPATGWSETATIRAGGGDVMFDL